MTSGNYTSVKRIHFLWSPRFLLFCLLYSILPFAKAQDQSNFTQFYLNPYLINPSHAGIDGQSAFSLIYKRQWINIDGGPSLANISLHTPVNPQTGVGISVTNDRKGLLNNSAILFSFSYNVVLQEHTFLRFGLSAGGAWNVVDTEKLNSANDPAFSNLLDNNASLAGNAGVSIHAKFFHFGIAIPSIFSPSYISEDAFNITTVKPFQTLIIHASNRFYFNNNKNVFEPYALYRLNSGVPSQFEVAGIVHLNHLIWAGASFKQDFGISALGGIKLQNMLAIGASYSVKNSGINELNSPTFEVSLSYLIGKRKKGTHAYSFVNTVKEKEKKPARPTPTDALTAKKRQEELERKKLEAKKREEDILKKRQEALAKAEAEQKKAQDSATFQQHRPRFGRELSETPKSTEEIFQEQEKQALKKLDEHAENPTEHHGEDPDLQPHAERHEFVKRGDHDEELEVADYVIGGVFKSDANAKHFAEGLNKLGFKANYGHLTEKNLWYVYLIQTTDINEARAERDRVRKMKIMREAWLLTVHH